TTPMVDVDVVEVKKNEGDVWLVCSDGLFNTVEDDEIQDILLEATGENAVEQLLEMTLERGAEDNVTILLGYVSEVSEA
ncbi:MAG: protein phosphatase, partial [Bacillota bacterium]